MYIHNGWCHCDSLCIRGLLFLHISYKGFWCYSGEKIEHMLYYWYGDYELLEDNHNYIQWYVLLPRYASTVYAVTVSVHLSQAIVLYKRLMMSPRKQFRKVTHQSQAFSTGNLCSIFAAVDKVANLQLTCPRCMVPPSVIAFYRSFSRWNRVSWLLCSFLHLFQKENLCG